MSPGHNTLGKRQCRTTESQSSGHNKGATLDVQESLGGAYCSSPASWALSLERAGGPSGVGPRHSLIEGGQGHRRLGSEVIVLIV